MHKKQRVADMVEEVLACQAKARAERIGEPFGKALRAVFDTDAGEQLSKLRDGPHRYERAEDWQASIARERAVEQVVALGWSMPAEDSVPSKDDREQERPG
jgi:hypothetical protein